MSHDARKRVFGVPNRSDTNRPAKSQKEARKLEFRIFEEDGLYYMCSENKGAEQLICAFVFAYEISDFLVRRLKRRLIPDLITLI